MMDEKPKRDSSRTGVGKILLIIAVSLFACIAFAVAIVALVFGLTQSVVDTGNAYFQAIQDGQMQEAYAMLTPALQDEISYDDFVATFGNDTLESWFIYQRSIENGIGKMAGSTMANGERLRYELYFRKIDDEWRITGYRFD